MLVNERQTFAQFRRSFHFAQPLDPKSVKAKLEHGQLCVCVNKQVRCASAYNHSLLRPLDADPSSRLLRCSQKEDEGVTSIEVE